MLKDVELENEKDIRKANSHPIEEVNIVYIFYFLVSVTIIYGIWCFRPTNVLNQEKYNSIRLEHEKDARFINFTIKSRKKKYIRMKNLSIFCKFTSKMFRDNSYPVLYEGKVNVYNEDKIDKEINLEKLKTKVFFKNDSKISDPLELISFDDIKLTKVEVLLNVTSLFQSFNDIGTLAMYELDEPLNFIKKFRKMMLVVIIALVVSTLLTKRDSPHLLLCEAFILVTFYITKSKTFTGDILASIGIAMVHYFLMYEIDNALIKLTFSGLMCSISLLTSIKGLRQYSFISYITALFEFYCLFSNELLSSGSVVAVFLTAFSSFSNTNVKLAYAVAGLIILYFILSDQYWITILLIVMIAFPFLFSPFDLCRITVKVGLPQKHVASFKYTSDWAEYPIPHFLYNYSINHCVACNTTNTSSSLVKSDFDDTFVTYLDKYSDIKKLISFVKSIRVQGIKAKLTVLSTLNFLKHASRNEINFIQRCGSSITLVDKTNATELKKGIEYNIIYDLLNINDVAFNRVMYINTTAISGINEDPFNDRIEKGKVYTLENMSNNFFIGYSDTIRDYAKSVLNKSKTENIVYLKSLNITVQP